MATTPQMDLRILFIAALSALLSVSWAQPEGSLCIRANARSCGECIRVSESCGWCTDPSFLTAGGLNFARCDDLESLKKRNCPAESIENPRGRVEITKNEPAGRESGGLPERIIQIQPQKLTLTLRSGEPQTFQLKFSRAEDEPQSSSSRLSSLSSEVILENSKLPEGVSINYKSICKNRVEATGENGRKCSNVSIGDEVFFQISVQTDKCPAETSGKSETIKIKPLGFTEEVEIVLNFICDCPCAATGVANSSQCHFGNGIFECGACKCNEGRVGRVCECSTDEMYAEDPDANCRKDSGTDICSNNGDCVCGVCECRKRDNPAERYSGRFCECDNFNCDRSNNMLCGGHGRCECRMCVCDAGYTGSACDCSLDASTCMAKNGQICNGRGFCDCGTCRCTDIKFQGPTCEICPTCPGVCQEHKDCVLCRAFPSEKSCTNCNYFDLIMVSDRGQLPQPTDQSYPLTHCKVRDENDCWVYYTFALTSQTKVVHVVDKADCPSPSHFGWMPFS